MKTYRRLAITIVTVLTIYGCENRDINEGEAFRPREIHEDIVFNFDKITVDGIEYLILEKDNNNPHEGFGFMAFRANKLMEKQDTVMAYLRTMRDFQVLTYAAISKRPVEQVNEDFNRLFNYYLNEEETELLQLEESNLRSSRATTPGKE
ncbi:hypothetical protein [Marinoscillum sp. 108]|jgi:hypothetical protein|uniref:DUF4296 domain-containing protein n=1 Tax=Marinoscillum luteum TaxID=861051 RepID=A0ABW7N2P7_9BACT|nr:hypothetical protein [Marinoscillum sp. 108]VXD12559.1 conserved hypothetical protein [Marinoscillum sp. 108]